MTDYRRCESYNTAQIQLLAPGDSESSSARDECTGPMPIGQPRNTQNRNEMARSVPGPAGLLELPVLPSGPLSSRRSSYSSPRPDADRPRSPVVGNYFGISRDRRSESLAAATFDENATKDDNGQDLDFWGRSDAQEEEDTSAEEDDVDDEEDDDDIEEDDDDSIDIFGHR